MKLCSHIQNFPIVNDSNAQGLLRKFRVDINYHSKTKDTRPYEIKPPIIPKERMENFTNQILNPNSNIDHNTDQELKRKYSLLEKERDRLAEALKQAEEENRRLLAGLSTSGNKYNQLREMVSTEGGGLGGLGDRYDIADKLQHIDHDISEVGEIMTTVNMLHDKVKKLEEERRQIEEENSALRLNNQNLASELDKVVTESNNYKTNSDNELYNLKELLNSTKNELDYMRNEAEKYRKIQQDLMLEIDEREVQFKKSLEDKEREIELKMIDLSQNEKRKIESELREATRKIETYGEENGDYGKIVDELKKENNKLNLKVSEMRNTIRDIFAKNIEDKKDNKVNISGMMINPDSKVNLIKSYTSRESELMEQVGIEKAKSENFKEKLKKMRTYGRKVRNMALDYFPINEQLPDLLTKDINVFLEDAENESVIQFLEFEIRTLRERNSKLEHEKERLLEEYKMKHPYDDYKKLQATSKVVPLQKGNTTNISNSNSNAMNQLERLQNTPNNNNNNNNLQLNELEIQKRLLDEINKLKNNRPYSTSQEIQKLKKENELIIDENKKLKSLINETLIKEDKLINDNPSAFKQKILFLEKTIEQLERERSTLSVRATMAEEQLKNTNELSNATSQAYQRKILELNKRVIYFHLI